MKESWRHESWYPAQSSGTPNGVEAGCGQGDRAVHDPMLGTECPKQDGASDLKHPGFVWKNSRGMLVDQG